MGTDSYSQDGKPHPMDEFWEKNKATLPFSFRIRHKFDERTAVITSGDLESHFNQIKNDD